MAWARIDDSFHDHPKVIGLSLPAIGLWTLTLTWANRHTSGARMGFIPEGLPQRLGAVDDSLSAELVAAGLWEQADGGWAIHDFCDYLDKARHPSTADAVRAERSAAGKRGAAARWQVDGKLPSSEWQVDGNTDGKTMPRPVPSRPSPSKSKDSSSADADFETFWAAYPRHEGRARALTAYRKARRVADADAILAGAIRYRDDPNRDPAYTKHATTWLNGACWDDDPLPSRTPTRPSPVDMYEAGMAELAAMRDQQQHLEIAQ